MEDRPLSPVYLDNEPVEIEDSKPLVSQVVRAGGKRRGVRVVRLASRSDMQGSPLGPDDVIDRTEVTPVYLKSTETPPETESLPGAPGPHLSPGPEPPLPPAPMPDRDPSPPPPGPLPQPDPDPQLRDVEHAPSDVAEGQVE